MVHRNEVRKCFLTNERDEPSIKNNEGDKDMPVAVRNPSADVQSTSTSVTSGREGRVSVSMGVLKSIPALLAVLILLPLRDAAGSAAWQLLSAQVVLGMSSVYLWFRTIR